MPIFFVSRSVVAVTSVLCFFMESSERVQCLWEEPNFCRPKWGKSQLSSRFIAALTKGQWSSFSPLRDEPDPRPIEELAGSNSQIVVLGQDASIDPLDTAHELLHAHGDVHRAVLLIPGRSFDLTGTRHGRGRGWYDRVLHELPRNWTRVGIASLVCLHQEELLRQPWDEPMDCLMLNGADGWHMRLCTNHRGDQ